MAETQHSILRGYRLKGTRYRWTFKTQPVIQESGNIENTAHVPNTCRIRISLKRPGLFHHSVLTREIIVDKNKDDVEAVIVSELDDMLDSKNAQDIFSEKELSINQKKC